VTHTRTIEAGTKRIDFSSDLFTRWIPRFLGYAIFLGAWQLVSGRFVSAFLLPSPSAIAQKMWDIIVSGDFIVNFWATVQKILIGYSIAYVLGVAIAVLMARKWWDGFFRDWVVVMLNTPGLIFVIVCTVTFGLSMLSPITAVIITAYPFVTVNVVEGVRDLPKDLIDMGRAFRVSGFVRLRKIILPFLAPYLFTGLRYGFSTAWKVVTLSEVFGAASGIGLQFRLQFQLFSIRGMLAWIFLFFAFALFLEKVLLQAGERRFFRWRKEVKL
jgi:NitT/TauT family transport system permease protein